MWYYYARFLKRRKQWAVYGRWRGKNSPRLYKRRHVYIGCFLTYYHAIDTCVLENAFERNDYQWADARGYYNPPYEDYDEELDL